MLRFKKGLIIVLIFILCFPKTFVYEVLGNINFEAEKSLYEELQTEQPSRKDNRTDISTLEDDNKTDISDFKNDEESKQKRISISEYEYYVNGRKLIVVNLKDRKLGERLNIEITNPYGGDALEAQITAIDGDNITVCLKSIDNGFSIIEFSTEDESEKLFIQAYSHIRTNLSINDIYELANKSTVEITSFDAAENKIVGSGFFIGKGRVLTNYHVVEYAVMNLKVIDNDGQRYKVLGIEAYSTTSDLAVLRTERLNDSFFFMAESDDVLTGEVVYNMGSPLGYRGTFAAGLVSYAERELSGIKYIQTFTPISQSSGGGPLINKYGEVIGVNTITINAGQYLNFAVKGRYYNLLAKDYIPIEDFYKLNEGKIKEN